MKHFEKGERVHYEYAASGNGNGTVLDHECDYGDHMLKVQFDGRAEPVWYHDNGFTHIDDPYEYNVERTGLEYGTSHLQFNQWMALEEATDDLAGYIEAEDIHEKEEGFRFATYRMVKRRKAGRIEDV